MELIFKYILLIKMELEGGLNGCNIVGNSYFLWLILYDIRDGLF